MKTLCDFLSLCSGFSCEKRLFEDGRPEETQQVRSAFTFVTPALFTSCLASCLAYCVNSCLSGVESIAPRPHLAHTDR